MKFKGADWIKESLKKEMSPIGENVADLLGEVYAGIYHLDHRSLDRVHWDDPYFIRIIISYRGLSTVDSNQLTALVVRAHDRMLRMDLSSVAPHRLELIFHQRSREGDFYHRCPTIEEHIKLIRESV